MRKNRLLYAAFCFLMFPLVVSAKNRSDNTPGTGQIPWYLSSGITGSDNAAATAPAFSGSVFAQNVIEEEDILIDEEKSTGSDEDILEESLEEKKPQESESKEEKIDANSAVKEKETPASSSDTTGAKQTVEGAKPDALPDTASKATVEDAGDMDLILEDEDELIVSDDKEELLITEEPKKDTSAAHEVLKGTSDTALAGPDSLKQAITPVVEGEEILTEPETVKEAEHTGEEKAAVTKKAKKKKAAIEEARAINFDRNLKDYRSPRKAMFMSLLLPGLGQAYTKKYWKTAALGVLEGALIGFAIKHAVNGKDQLERARDYADIHYDPEMFFTFYRNFMEFFPDSPKVDFANIFGDTLDNYVADFTGITKKPHTTKKRPDFDKLIQHDKSNPSVFVQGWDDCEPVNNPNGYIHDSSTYLFSYDNYNKDTTWMLNRYKKGDTIPIERGTYGYSLHQQEYTRIIRLSNHYYNVTQYLIFGIVANHLLSAVDAFISARSYNDMLLNKQSLWRRIDLDHQVAVSDYGIETRLDLKVRF